MVCVLNPLLHCYGYTVHRAGTVRVWVEWPLKVRLVIMISLPKSGLFTL
jgi:hypothetical protein